MTTRQILVKFLEQVRLDIIAEQSEKGIRNTGASAESLRVVSSRSSARLESVGYFRFLYKDQGRRPGGFPPLKPIIDWMRTKNITPGADSKGRQMTINQAAFTIARKIARLGTSIYQNPSKGIDLDAIIERHLDNTIDTLGDEIRHTFVEHLNKNIIRV